VRALGVTPQRPRPRATPADPVAQDACNKGGAAAVAAVRTAHPDATVTGWAEDAHRIGVLPVLRRVWAPRGQRPIARVRRRSQWRSVSGFVCPSTGQRGWW
jgi:hypothetical protein